MTSRIDVLGGALAIVEESHALPLVSIVLALRTGSGSDPSGKAGVARMTARMVRRGCKGLDARAIEATIDRLGAEMLVDTSASSVALHIQVIGRNLDAFIELLARLLATPEFPEDELERLRRESIAEVIEARDSDRVVAQKAFQRELFAGHPYGRNAGGTTASLAAITLGDVRAFFAKHFVKGNVVLGFSGDITPERAAEAARRIVAGLPDGAAHVDATPDPTPRKGRELVFVDKPERTQTQILIGRLGTWHRDPDHVAIGAANAIFGGTFTSRLVSEVRSKRGWSYGAASRLSLDRRRQAFTMWTFPAADDAAACLALELELLEAFVSGGVTAEETEFIKKYLIRSHVFDVDTANKRLHQALDVELLGLAPDYYSGYVANVAKVTAEDASDAVKARLDPEDLVIVVVGTAEEIFDAVKAAVPRVATAKVVPFDAE